MGEEAGLKSLPADQVMVSDLETPGHFRLKSKGQREKEMGLVCYTIASFVRINGGTSVWDTISLGIPDTKGQ